MRAYRRYSTVAQLAAGLFAFVAGTLLLESGGLYEWAQRLELGPERTVLLPVAGRLAGALARTGIEQRRQQALAELARLGWSDDPAAIAAQAAQAESQPLAPPPSPPTPPTQSPTLTLGAQLSPQPTASTPVATKPTTPPEPSPVAALVPLHGDPPLLSHLPDLPPVPPGKTRTVALAGDSMMAVGLSSTLLREAPRYRNLALLKTFRSGTGLARPEVFDWRAEYPAMLGGARPDVVLVAIGANDGQGFVEAGATYPFGSPGWRALYQRRVQAFLDMLESGGATVVWVGLPPMKSGAYDARIALVNRIDYAVVSASAHAIWFSTGGLLGDAQGRFQDFGPVHGRTARLRQPDGVHISDDGAQLVVTRLLPWLARQQTSSTAEPAAETSLQPPAAHQPTPQIAAQTRTQTVALTTGSDR